MPIFEVTAPDGKTYEVNAPEGATQEQAFEYVKQKHYSGADPSKNSSKSRSAADIARDVGVTAIKGAVALPEAFVGLADIPTGGRVGKALEGAGIKFKETQDILSGQYSEQQQAANKKVQEADGFVDTTVTALQNPSTIATAIGESIPQMLGGAGIARMGIKAADKMGRKVAPWLAGAIGEGTMAAGSAAEGMRQESDDGLLSGKQTAAALGTGAGTAIFGAAGGKLAQKFGFGDMDTILAKGGPDALAAGAAKKGFMRQVVEGGISEGVFEEMPQSIQETMWQNWANDKPLMEGTGNAAAMGMLAGIGMGAGGGGYNAAMGREVPAQVTPQAQTNPVTPPVQPTTAIPVQPTQQTPSPTPQAAPIVQPTIQPDPADALDAADLVDEARAPEEIIAEAEYLQARQAELTPENGYGEIFDAERQDIADRLEGLQQEIQKPAAPSWTAAAQPTTMQAPSMDKPVNVVQVNHFGTPVVMGRPVSTIPSATIAQRRDEAATPEERQAIEQEMQRRGLPGATDGATDQGGQVSTLAAQGDQGASADVPGSRSGLQAGVSSGMAGGSTGAGVPGSADGSVVPAGPTSAPGVTAAADTTAADALMTQKPITALDRVTEIDAEANRLQAREAELSPENGYSEMFNTERQDVAARRAELSQERESITASWPKAITGQPTSFSTEAGVRLEAQYALMDAGELTTSHDENLRPTPTYPPELQPRQRDRAASEMQIAGIVQRLDPARLGESADAANGAPIVGADGLVESGNARTIALKRIYQAKGQRADEYKQYLKDNAQRFGLAPEQIDGMAAPVLVRVRTTPVNRAEFARQANAATVAQMSPSEQAKSDAARIDSLEGLNPDDNGDFMTGTSRDFVRGFMARIPGTEQSGMIDAAGNLSQTGYTRLRNAVLAKAYGDSPVLLRMVESLDDNIRNLSKSLIQAAPTVAKARQSIQEGLLFDSDITPDLLAAVEELSRLKDEGKSVHDALAQAGMFGEQYSPETRELLQFLADNIRRPRKIAEFIKSYFEGLNAAGNPNQGSLLGDTAAPAKGDLMNAARRNQDGTEGIPQDRQTGEQGGKQREDAPGDQKSAEGNQENTGPAESAAAVAVDAPAVAINDEVDFRKPRYKNINDAEKAIKKFGLKKVGVFKDGDQFKIDTKQGANGEAFDLTGDTPEQVKANEEAQAAKAKSEQDAADKAEAEAKAKRIAAEVESRKAASAENFQLGQNAEDALAGQGDLLSAPINEKRTDGKWLSDDEQRAQAERDYNADIAASGKVRQVRVNGEAEMIPADAVEHRKTAATLEDKSARGLSVGQELDLYEKQAVLADKLAANGWSNDQIAANSLNMTVKAYKEQVKGGFYGKDYGLDVERLARARSSTPTPAQKAPTQETDKGVAMFSRNPGAGIPMDKVQSLADRISAANKNMPKVRVFASPAELDRSNQSQAALYAEIEAAGAMSDVEGAAHDGEIYLFSDNLADEARAEHVLAIHEVTHHGLRKVFGAELNPILQSIWANNANVRKQAAALGERLGLKSNTAAVEEVLADMKPAELVKLKGWRQLAQFMRDWFQNHGFTALAGKLDSMLKAGMTDQQQADMLVADVVNAARDWVKVRPDAQPAGRATALPTQTAASRTRDGMGAGPVASDATVPSLDQATRRDTQISSGSPAGAESNASITGKLSRMTEDRGPGADLTNQPTKPGSEEFDSIDELRGLRTDLGKAIAEEIKQQYQEYVLTQQNDNSGSIAELLFGEKIERTVLKPKDWIIDRGFISRIKIEGSGNAFLTQNDIDAIADIIQLRGIAWSDSQGSSRIFDILPDRLKTKERAYEDTGSYGMEDGLMYGLVDSLVKKHEKGGFSIETVEISFDEARRKYAQDRLNITPVSPKEIASRFIEGNPVGLIVKQSGEYISYIKANQEAISWEFGKMLDDVKQHNADATPEARRAKFKIIKDDSSFNRSGQSSGRTKLSRASQSNLPGVSQSPTVQPPSQQSANLQGGSAGNQSVFNTPEPSKMDDIIFKLQDSKIDLKRAIQGITDSGRQIADKWNTYMQEELFHGRSAKRVKDFTDRELAPMLREMALRKVSIADLDKFLWARHAKEANALIEQRDPGVMVDDVTGKPKGSGMTDQEADDYFAGLSQDQRNQLDAIAKKVDDMLVKTRELYVSYGLEDRDTVQGWADMFQHYVPLMREDHDGGMGIGQGFSIKGREAKHRTGSTRAVADVLANIATQRERAIVRGEKNRVAVSLAGLVKLNPAPDFWTLDKIPQERVLNEKTGQVETREVPNYRTRDNVIIAKIKDSNGNVKERAIVLNERDERAVRLAKSMKNIDIPMLEGWLGTAAAVTRYFSAINTQYNPVFGAINLIRDVGAGALNLSSTALKGKEGVVTNPKRIASAVKGIYSDARKDRKGQVGTSPWAQLWEDFTEQGGQTGYRDMFKTSNDRADAMQSVMDPTSWTEGKWGQFFTAKGALKVPLVTAQKAATPLFNWLSDYNLAMENAVRLSAYKEALDSGMSKPQAASLAKNLTVNFNRKGAYGAQAGALYAFFNAATQGTARIGETLTRRDPATGKYSVSDMGKKIIGGGVMLGVMQAVALAMAGFDDDEPPEFIRERNIIIPLMDGKYVSIPMPLGFHVIPNIGRIATETVMGRRGSAVEAVIDLMGITFEAFNPIGSAGWSMQTVAPTILDPMAAIIENKDWTGKPIAKEKFSNTDPTPGFDMAKDNASTIATGIAYAINLATGGSEFTSGKISPTPDQLDYLWGQVTGGVGRETNKIYQSVESMFTGEELPPHKIPLAGRLYGDTQAKSSINSKFYQNVIDMKRHKAEYMGRKEKGDSEGAAEYLADNPDAKLFRAVGAYESKVQQLRSAKRKAVEQGISQERVKMIEQRTTELMTRFNEQVKSAQ